VTYTDTAPQPSAPAAPHKDERLARAKRRVAALKGFYIHLLVFAVVLTGLFAINFLTGGPWWVLWALFGWGIGLLAHAIAVMARTPKTIADWEARKLRQYMAEER